MMPVLVEIAVKSLLIAGLTLGLLQLMKKRSAAERSWIAHVGLLALVIIAFAPLILPSWTIEAPGFFSRTSERPGVSRPVTPPVAARTAVRANGVFKQTPIKAAPALPSLSPAGAATAIYAMPAVILLFITLLALVRLIALRARAEVLVDTHWLSALARAQRRMGFKHGTALLTSNELASPISWGLMRPVILLNRRAVEAAGEAEAIIAHELAHVANMDWIKLLLARIATALFWFNPLVWLLAREAHQLREEAADDSVLAADIIDTDYAQLLVGVARHDCPGLLLGAHGVAPSKSSLARRVARVLDGKSVRGPVARSFALGVFSGAVLVAAPLAALTLTPAIKSEPKFEGRAAKSAAEAKEGTYFAPNPVPSDLPRILASGVATSVETAEAAVAPHVKANSDLGDFEAVGPDGATVRKTYGTTIARGSDGASVTLYPPDAQGRRKLVAVAANGATVSYANAGDQIAGPERSRRRQPASEIDQLIQMKAAGVTPEYVNAMRAVSPRLRSLEPSEFVALQSVGIDPLYVRDLGDAGLRNLDEEDLIKAKSIGLSPNYVRALIRAGMRPDINDFVQLRSMNIPAEYVASLGKSGRPLDAGKITQMWAVGVKPEDFEFRFNFSRPVPPKPRHSSKSATSSGKALPAASPPDWKAPDSDPGG